MPSLFDRLNAELNDDQSSGITPLDIVDLPDHQRSLMVLLLRDQAGAADGVAREALAAKFVGSGADFDLALLELTRNGWLVVMGEQAQLRYRVNLRAKRGSNTGFGLWSVLSDRIPKDRPT
jgi:hypothetical protein